MSDMVSVPAEKIAALREIVEQGYVRFNPHELYRRARAVVDAVETEDERIRHNHMTRDIKPRGKCPACDVYHDKIDALRLAPSPARDDAERAIAGLLAEHTHWQYAKYSEDRTTVCVCGALEIGNLLDAEAPLPPDAHRAHVASVIAAHMAAPDELTALRAEADRNSRLYLNCHENRQKIEAERDALRERIRALADECAVRQMGAKVERENAHRAKKGSTDEFFHYGKQRAWGEARNLIRAALVRGTNE